MPPIGRRSISSVALRLGALFLLGASIGVNAQDVFPSAAKPPDRSSWADQPKYKPDELLVRFRSGTTEEKKNLAHSAVRAEQVKSWASVEGLQLVRLSTGVSIKDAIKLYRQRAEVLYAEPNYYLHAFTTPNDPKFSQLWGLQNTGQLTGTVGADIHASQAWSITTGSSNVVVAVVDTGMDYTHQDLAANAWNSTAPYSISVNGTTINCPVGSHGFNAVNNTCDPMDDNGHGTHVSGTIGAAGNNGVGVAGVNWSVRIMPCKFLDASGGGTTDAAVTCLDFVKSMKDAGEKIVATNNSWGGGGFSQALFDAIQAQQQDGVLFIAAAGNDSSNTDLGGFYPGGYFLPNILSVAATTRFDWLANFSNIGTHSVTLGAPGQEILSTFPNNSYAWLNGTSMATPHVTGVAALLAAQDPSRDWRAIKNLLIAGGDAIPALTETISGKRLNAYGSMTCSNSTVARRLQPTLDTIVGSAGTPILLAALNINCAQPAGPVTVNVVPGNQVINLADNGTNPDQAAQDGIYTGQWTPPGVGNYTLTFSTSESIQVTVLQNYVGGETGYNYQTIAGTNLNLGDDDLATLNLPFPVKFGGAGFSTAYVSSNGTISFTNAFDDYLNFSIPVNFIENLDIQNSPPPDLLQPVVTLVAPYWMDLYPVKGSSQNVFWAVTGTAPNRQLVVEWRNVRSFACRTDSNTNVTFEVIFSESSSNVIFNYANASFGNACSDEDDGQVASIGVQVSQNVGTQWGGPFVSQYIPGQSGINQPTVASGMALQWTLTNPNAPPNPLPVVTSISPASVPAGSPDTWVTLTGTGFVPDSQSGSPNAGPTRVIKFISSTQVQMLFTAADLLFPSGTPGIQVNITNPAPGGGTSLSVYLLVTQSNPVITLISPTSVPAGSFGFNMTVTGSGFIPYATELLFNGGTISATVVSPTQAIFPIIGPLVQTAGTVNVQVQVGPSTFSNTVPFTITPSTSPATLQAPAATGADRSQLDQSKLSSGLLSSRFLGRKAAQFLGPAYAEKYQRLLSQSAPAASARSSSNVPQALGFTTAALTTTAPTAVGFNFPPDLPSGFLPTAVVSGDFNGDGKLDWAVANAGDNTVWIYLGNGDGTASLPTIVRLNGFAPVALAAADMNGDGKLDLVVAEADSLSVAVLLGNGDGTFGPERLFATPSLPISLAIADFDGDGKLDVVVGLLGFSSTGQLAFLAGDGTGKLGVPVTHYEQGLGAITYTFNIAAADLNGDGLPDIVAADFLVDSFNGQLIEMRPAGAQTYLNQGQGNFKLAQEFFGDLSADQYPPGGQAVTAIALGDINKDGCIDAVTLDTVGSATFFPGLCDGTFDTANSRIFGSGIVADAAQLADLNGDGKLDLVSSSYSYGSLLLDMPSSAVSVQFGDGLGNFGAPTLYRGDPHMAALAVADLKKNGRPEVITANEETSTITVFQNDGTGSLGQTKGGYVGYLQNGLMHAIGNAPASDFAVVDLNGDGHPDLATVEYGSQFPLPAQMTVLLNNGTGGFGAPIRTPIALGPGDVTDFVFGDFRHTGRKDLLFIVADLQNLQVDYRFAASNGDGTFQKPVLATVPLTTQIPLLMALGDFNSDGKLDFLVAGPVGYQPMFGNGDGTFTPGPSASFPPSSSQGITIRGIQVADVNGDGKADLLLLGAPTNSSTAQFPLYVALGNGDGTFQDPKVISVNVGPVAVVDLNKDGHPDIIAAIDGGTDPNIFGHLWTYQVLLGNGDGTFTPGQTYGPFPNPFADFYYREYFFGSADHPSGTPQPMIGDFNGDGNLDIAVFTTAGTNFFNSVGFAGAPLDTQVLVLAGNGDGTFSVPSFGQPLGSLLVPQKAADLDGNGFADLVELNRYTSSYTILNAMRGGAFSAGLISNPVIGASGKLLLLLRYPSNTATTLQLSASDANISIPASVTIPAGTVTEVVPFQIGAAFDPNKVFGLTAQLGTESHTAFGTQAASGQNVGFGAILQLQVTPVVTAGQTTPDYGLLIGSIGGYSTQISTTCVGLPTGASCQIAPNSASLPSGGVIAVSLKVSTQTGIAAGQYSFTVNVTDGAVSSNLAATFDVGDFSMSLSPASQTLGATDFASYTLNVQGIDGFSQPIQITCGGLPTGITCPFNTAVLPGSNSFQIHTQNTPTGTYTFTLTGTSNGITRTATAQMIVTSGTFSGSVSPPSGTITVGGSQTFTVQINSSGGFQGQVSLSCVSSSGVTCQFASDQLSLAAGGTASTTLTVKVNSKPAGIWPYFSRGIRRFDTKSWMNLFLLFFVLVVSYFYKRLQLAKPTSAGAQRLSPHLVSVLLLVVVFSLSSCGGGASSGGGGGGGGGGATVTSVTVQGTAGGNPVTLGTITISIP